VRVVQNVPVRVVPGRVVQCPINALRSTSRAEHNGEVNDDHKACRFNQIVPGPNSDGTTRGWLTAVRTADPMGE